MGWTTLRTFLEEVVQPELRGNWKRTADGGSTLFYPNGSRVTAVGLDDPGRARSAMFNAAFVDEAQELDEEEWNAIGGRLRLRIGDFRQLGAACNPEGSRHFLFKRFRPDRGTHKIHAEDGVVLPDGRTFDKGRLLREVICSGPTDNYANLPEDYLLRLSSMAGRYRQRYVEGLWVDYEGLIYDCFDERRHIIARPEDWNASGGYPPADWKRGRAIDFGYVNPFVCQWWARSPDGHWFMYREIYQTKRLVSEHAQEILRFEQAELEAVNRATPDPRRRLRIRWSVADHDAEDRATLEHARIFTRAANKDVASGLQTVYELLRGKEDGTGAPMLSFVRGALVERDPMLEAQQLPTSTVEEFQTYHYPKLRSGTEEKGPVEKPTKVNDHGMDAMRYFHHTLKLEGDLSVERVFTNRQSAWASVR